MATKYILAALAIVFLFLALSRLPRGGMVRHPQSRTWLLISVIFGIVSIYLFSQG